MMQRQIIMQRKEMREQAMPNNGSIAVEMQVANAQTRCWSNDYYVQMREQAEDAELALMSVKEWITTLIIWNEDTG